MKGEFMSLETAQKLAYNDKINELHNTIDAKDKIINEQVLEIARLKEINKKVYKYLDEKKDVPEWWDTDFMICMDMLKGGNGNLIEILLGEKE